MQDNTWPPEIAELLKQAAPKWEPVIQDKIKNPQQRGARKRGWIKLDKSLLHSSINYRMQLDEQAVFLKLLLLADEQGPVAGLISDNDLRPIPFEALAHQAYAPLEIVMSTLQKGIIDDAIYINSHGIFITHFDDYQFTEYDRQKPYRQAKRQGLKKMTPEERKAYFEDPARQAENEARSSHRLHH